MKHLHSPLVRQIMVAVGTISTAFVFFMIPTGSFAGAAAYIGGNPVVSGGSEVLASIVHNGRPLTDVTPTATPTDVVTATATLTSTITPTATATVTSTETSVPTATETPTNVPTATSTPVDTTTPTITPTVTSSPTITATPAVIITPTVTVTPTAGCSVPGWGYGDQNHVHTGPPGLGYTRDTQNECGDQNDDSQDSDVQPTAVPVATPVPTAMPTAAARDSRPESGESETRPTAPAATPSHNGDRTENPSEGGRKE